MAKLNAKKIIKQGNKISKRLQLEKEYNKQYKKLMRNVNKVVKEGFTINIQIPTKPKSPTKSSIARIEKLNKKVLDESRRYDKERGKIVTRRAVLNRERIRRGEIKRLEKALKEGKTLSDKKRKELLNERLNTVCATSEPLALNDIRVIKYIDRVEETFFRLEHTVNKKNKVNRGLIEWVMDWRSIFHDWINSHSDAERMAAFKQVKWSKFMVKYYPSDGVGLYDFLVDFENEMLHLTSIQSKVDIDIDLTDAEMFIAQDVGV